ncbi:high affinity camp [Lichtheimia corymbifera JMRC:FSU:9682]|uniref:Phosphodiesterase n=1 Tax=Lichtheimia corymbifera JMRC:FSU:9682 TaxID=1263082 RepID=A0A068SCX4_9FUNG|nr:high affinity camp [Lichtheimia corymbifera JMRC:FSU:9682]
MHPNQCSVVLVTGDTNRSQDTVSMCKAIYDEVQVASDGNDALKMLRNHPRLNSRTTLLIIDVDTHDRKINDQQHCAQLLQKIKRQLKNRTLHDVIPIVCSCRDAPDFMIECIVNGAADFIVKPIRQEVVKSLFLNAYRYQVDLPAPMTRYVHHNQRSPLQTSDSSSSNGYLGGQVWAHFQDRLKSVFLNENWLLQTVYNYYCHHGCMPHTNILPMSRDKTNELQRQVCSWDFLSLDLSIDDLVAVVCVILKQVLELPELVEYRVSDDDMLTFVFDVCNSYHQENPYHNFRHAVDVLQSTYFFLCKIGVIDPFFDSDPTLQRPDNAPGLQTLLRPLDVFAILLASLGHDIGHPGVTNTFMVQSSTPLAVLYNDRSVLESFHSMAFFHILGNSCFRKLTEIKNRPDHAYFRKVVIHSILATDMSMHDEYVRRVEEQAEAWKNDDIDISNKEVCDRERLTLCGALIKCADIGNCARPFEVAKSWAEVLAEEFAQQGDLENELGLEGLPINQRGKVTLEQFQLTFKRNIAIKLYKAVAQVAPGMRFCTRFIEENIIKWEERESSCNHDSGVTVHVEGGNEDEDREQAGTCLEQDEGSSHLATPTRRRSSGSLPYEIRSPDVRRDQGAKGVLPYEVSSPEVQNDQAVQSEQEGPTAANSMQNTARRKSDVFSLVSSDSAPQPWPRRQRKKVRQDSHSTSCQCLLQ